MRLKLKKKNEASFVWAKMRKQLGRGGEDDVLYLVFLTERRYQLSLGSLSVQSRYLI